MKTRIIQTRFWEDDFISNASHDVKVVFLFLLTCPHINLSGVFQIPKKTIAFYLDLSLEEVEQALLVLEQEKKVYFRDGWVFVVNALKNNNYIKSEDTRKAFLEELDKCPKSLLDIYKLQYSDSTLYSTPKSTRNTKNKNKNTKTEIKNTKREGGVGETVAVLESNHMQDSEFKQTFDDFVQMRSEKKKPVTPTNRVAMLKKLDTYEITEAIAKLKQAIENGWQGFDFPVRQDNKSSPAQQNSPPTLYGKPLLVIN